jgi:hypothetical protein
VTTDGDITITFTLGAGATSGPEPYQIDGAQLAVGSATWTRAVCQ